MFLTFSIFYFIQQMWCSWKLCFFFKSMEDENPEFSRIIYPSCRSIQIRRHFFAGSSGVYFSFLCTAYPLRVTHTRERGSESDKIVKRNKRATAGISTFAKKFTPVTHGEALSHPMTFTRTARKTSALSSRFIPTRDIKVHDRRRIYWYNWKLCEFSAS